MRCLGRLLVLGLIGIGLIVAIAVAVGTNSGNDDGPSSTTSSVKPASYTVVSVNDVSIAGRPRYNIDVVMDPNASDAALQAGLADAVRSGFNGQPDAEVIVVFAHSDESLVNTGADVGRAFASTDGGGLGGSNSGLLGPDAEGIIQVEIHSMSNDAVQSMTKL